jgi:hypothetical protein
MKIYLWRPRYCSDGPPGSQSYHRQSGHASATYVVVEEKKHSHTKRLVPVDRIAESRPDLIRLTAR